MDDDDARRLYRRRHHATEREAAEAIMPQLNRLQRWVYAAAKTFDKGFTLVEISAALGVPNTSTIRTRVSELVAKGLVYETDQTRTYPPKANRHTVWRVKLPGEKPPPPAQATLL